jgi:hypothetical protein
VSPSSPSGRESTATRREEDKGSADAEVAAALLSTSFPTEKGMTMKRMFLAVAAVVATVVIGAAQVSAASGPSVTGGGSASDATRFALGVQNGTGHFECLMPGTMTVEAAVTSTSVSGSWATLHGRATVTLTAHTEFGAPGPLARGVTYTAMVRAGGPGSGYVDLEILGMSFKGTVEHGQIQISG